MIVTLVHLKANMRVLGAGEDIVITQKGEAAQAHIERLLGFKIEERFGGEDQEAIPEPLMEIVCLLAGHWYENREAVVTGEGRASVLPIGIWDVVNEYREFSFDG